MQCFGWLIILVAAVFVMVSLLRWFEQTTEAVENRWWNKVLVLILAPFSVWFFPSQVAAGRPTAVPRHEPVRGFGTVPKAKPHVETAAPATTESDTTQPSSDTPPPGTPREFIGIPKIPLKPKRAKPAIDPDKIARLKQKMKEQGMIDDET